MKVEHLRILPVALLYMIFIVLLIVPSRASADNKPYFKVYGADVMTGGWFASGGTCDTSTSGNYQDPLYVNAGLGLAASDFNGGILGYANSDASGTAKGGASSQYGVLSVGSIDGDTSANGVKGFYSGGAANASSLTTSIKYLTFANNTGAWGGKLEGASPNEVRQSNCIPDYYGKLPPTGFTAKTTADKLSTYNASGTYSIGTVGAGTNYDLNSNAAVSIADGTKLTVFVNGSVWIKNNITYTSGNDANNVPKFALIVKGSIYIDPSVTQLDGFYVAEPTSPTAANAVTTDSGIIWTCHPNDQARLPYTYPAQNCGSKLVINGAVAAKQVNFMRTLGNVSSAPTPTAAGSEETAAAGKSSGNVAEIINYTPQMVIGGSFFQTSTTNSASGLPIDSIFSLPPIF